MKRKILIIGIAATVLLLSTLYHVTNSSAQTESKKLIPKEKTNEYIRVVRPEGKKIPISMDTAIAHFEGKFRGETVNVDLIAAVHLGDLAYYDELNKRFKDYEVVLYELVVPEGVEIDENTFSKEAREERGTNPLSALQGGMSKTLGVVHQLEHVDYTAKNFVHADMTAEDFMKRVSERGDIANTFSRAFILNMSQQEESSKLNGRMFATLFSKNKTLSMKRIFADVMVDQMDDSQWVFSGNSGSALITDRNAIALERLREQFRAGKTKVAIFYGAAHLQEFAKSLKNDFRMKPTGVDWMIAWDLTADNSAREKTAVDK